MMSRSRLGQSSEKKTNHHSASGPEQVTGAVLQPIFTRPFQQSLDTYHVPILWKTVIIIPVPKKPSPKVQNDFRPVALTSIPFKYMDRSILRRLHAATRFKQDPMQFAYSANRSTEDAILTLLCHVYRHLGKPK